MAVSEARRGAAGALVIEGRDGAGARLFWERRTEDAPSLRGFHVVPGGMLDPLDASLPHDAIGLDPEDALPRVTALRELFEETGILLAEGVEALDDEVVGALRDAFLEQEQPEAQFRALGLRFRCSEMVPIGRWITPEFASSRYDAQFFAMRLTDAPEPSLDIREVELAEWVNVEDALARFARGEVLMTPPTLALLRNLEGGRLDERAMLEVFGARREPALRWEIVPDVQMLPFRTPTLPPATHTNTYLLGSGEALLVEPATPHADERERLLRWLREAERGGVTPIALFLTHHHIDHVGAANHLAELLDLPIWAHAMTAERLEGQIEISRHIEADERIVLRGPRPMSLRAVHTPGHAPGHLCLFEERSRVLLAGDMVASEGTILVEPKDGDMALYLRSLREMIRLDASMLLPAHGAPITQPRMLLEHYISHRLEREEKVRAALRSRAAPCSPADLVSEVYADVPPFVWPLAIQVLEAHLIKLESEGQARRGSEGWRWTA